MRLVVVIPLASRFGGFFDPFVLLPKRNVAIAKKDVRLALVIRMCVSSHQEDASTIADGNHINWTNYF